MFCSRKNKLKVFLRQVFNTDRIYRDWIKLIKKLVKKLKIGENF
jgi:hypothetical protein